MKPLIRAAVLLVAITAVVAVSAVIHAQAGGKSDSVVKVKARVEHPAPGKDVVIISFDVQKPFHLYANPVGNEDLANSQTTVKILGKNPPKVHVDYPAGKDYSHMGEKYKIYDGSFEIRATVDGSTAGMEALVKFGACDDNSCLQPATLRIPLK